jgi:hypothetical protein
MTGNRAQVGIRQDLRQGMTCKGPRAMRATSVGELFNAAHTSGVGRRCLSVSKVWWLMKRGTNEGDGRVEKKSRREGNERVKESVSK